MENVLHLVDNLVDLETSIEECIKHKEEICKRQRARKENASAGTAQIR